MEQVGINIGLLFVQSIFAIVMVGPPIISLIHLARKNLSGMPLVIWVLVICAVPFVGSLAFWIIKPAAESKV